MSIDIAGLGRIDVCIVATRRPDLLAGTLASFEANLFRSFEIGRIIANIDPAFGSVEDRDACVEIIRRYDPDASISLPDRPGFAAGVARNWLESTADVILQLEDDWLLHRSITPKDIAPLAVDPKLGQISFNHADMNWNHAKRGDYGYFRHRRRIFGLNVSFGRKRPSFIMAPSFYRGSFARGAAALMNPDFDPEKQFCRGVNPRLEAYVADYRNLIVGRAGAYDIEDTGRTWRKDRGIEKQVIGGRSYWSDGGMPGGDEVGAIATRSLATASGDRG